MQGVSSQSEKNTATAPRQRSPDAILKQMQALQAEYEEAQLQQSRRDHHQQQQQHAQPVLVQQSPSPKKQPRGRQPVAATQSAPKRRLDFTKPSSQAKEDQTSLLAPEVKERPSKFLKALDKGRSQLQTANERRDVKKATSFQAPPTKLTRPTQSQQSVPPEEDEELGTAGDRDEALRLVEKLEPGPKQFKPPHDDPDFSQYEPNSRIRLQPGSRTLSHEALQDHLDARYHISPSLLYSIVRPGRGTEMEVPVEADYVVIGVLAEKSGIKMTAPKSTSSAPAAAAGKDKKGKGKAVDDGFPADAKLDDALDGNTVDEQIDEDDPDNPAGQERQQQKKKRFVIFKLLDMRLKRDGLSSAGDSMLSLIMFESDSSRALYEADSDEELVDAHTGARMRKEDKKSGKRTDQRVYKGGSGGAYEKFWKEQNGTVVAILNPKVLKPRPQSGQWANTSNILTITPDSAESIVVIGRSKDLGTCAALRRDGQPCRAWCDKRVSDACDFHVQNALQKTRSGRSELMIGTSALTRDIGGTGMKRNGGLMARGGRPAPYDPANKIGLLPRDGRRQVDGVSTYVVKGSGNNSAGMQRRGGPGAAARGFGSQPPGFPMPSERREKEDLQERKKRRESEERTLLKVLQRDDGKSVGAKYLNRAGAKPSSKAVGKDKSTEEDEVEGEPSEDSARPKKRVFDATALRAIGFDPTKSESLTHLGEDAETKRRRMALVSSLGEHGPAHKAKLGHAPDWKRSNLAVPASSSAQQRTTAAAKAEPSSDDDLVVLPEES